MTVLANKLRVGAADSMVLFNTYDLGASTGGLEINYNPTVLQVEVDQAIMPVAAYATKEEVTVDVVLAQLQMSLVSAAFGYGSSSATGVITTASGTMAAGVACTLSTNGTPGSASYSYQVAAFNSNGDQVPAAATTIATGPTTLSSVNSINVIHVGNVTGAVGYKIIRTAGGTTQGLIGTVWGQQPSGFTFIDTGLAATAYTVASAAPANPNTDQINFGGTVTRPSGSFDAGIPKNDGTLLHWRLHLNKVVSSKAIKLDAKREKLSELSKCSFLALADLTQSTGRQAGYITEEYALVPLAVLAAGAVFHQPVAVLAGAVGAIGFGVSQLWRTRRRSRA